MLRTIGQGAAHYGATTGGSAYLDGVLASTVFDLDATIAASYPGTGTTWANLVPVPADGAARADYDFFTGNGATSSTYPTFNGTAGSPAAYWGFDGGDYFRLKSGTNTAFLNALHKTTGGSDWWVAITMSVVDTGTSQGLFCTRDNVAGSSGIFTNIQADESMRTQQRGAGVASPDAITTATGYTGNRVIIMSHSHSTNMTKTRVTNTTQDISQTYAATTGNAAIAFVIGMFAGGFNFLANNTKMYSFAMGNEYLDNTKAAAIIAHLETRHGRDYTP